MSEKNCDVFICYETTTGKSFAEHLQTALERHPRKFEVFLAAKTIPTGKHGQNEIDKALNQCKFFIVIITSLTIFSDEVKKEIKKAKDLNKIIIYNWFKGLTSDDLSELGLKDLQHPPEAEFETKEELANKVILDIRKTLESEEKGIKTEKDPEEISKRGYLLYTIYKFEDAIKEFDRALTIGPNHVKSLIGKGNTLVKLNNEADAFELFNKAIRIDAQNAYAWICIGGVYYRTRRYKEALTAYEEAIKIKLDYHLAWNGKGSALYQLKKYPEALVAYEEAIRLSPTYFWPWVGKGNVYYEYGKTDSSKYDDAIVAYEKVAELKPDFPGAYWRLARIYAIKKIKNDTLHYLQIAVKLNPDYKKGAKEDRLFEWLWGDSDFQKIVS